MQGGVSPPSQGHPPNMAVPSSTFTVNAGITLTTNFPNYFTEGGENKDRGLANSLVQKRETAGGEILPHQP